MRVLVTGGAGFIGSHSVDALLARGHDVRIVDALQPRVHPHGRPSYVPREAEFVEGDASDPDTMRRALAGVEAVLHLAAYQDYLPDFSRFVRVNTESSALLFELAVADPARYPLARIVFASSQAVAGEGKYSCLECDRLFWPDPRPLAQLARGAWEHPCPECGADLEPELIDEATCHNPHTAYAVSKYAIELLARALGTRHGIETVAMRYTYVQGARNSFHNAYSGIARRFALRLRAGLGPVCYEDGGQLRDYVGVADVVRANMVALEVPRAAGLTLNVGGGRGVTVLAFARIMAEVTGVDREPEVPGVYRVGDTRHTVSDLSRIRSLGWEPRVPVEASAREFVEWLDEHGPSADHLFAADAEMERSGVVRRAG